MLSKLPVFSYQFLVIQAIVSLITIWNLSLAISPVYAQGATPPCTAGRCPGAGIEQLESLVVRMIALASGLAGMAVIIMFVYAGIRFITSNGEPKNIQSAQQIATWAVIGTAALALSWIVLLIVGEFAGPGFTSQLTHVCFRFDGCP